MEQNNQKLNWNNLTINKCPKCNKDFMDKLETVVLKNGENLFIHSCGFKIRERIYTKINNNIISEKLKEELNKEEENL